MTTKELQEMAELKAKLKEIADRIYIKKIQIQPWAKDKQEFGFYSAKYRRLWNKQYEEKQNA